MAKSEYEIEAKFLVSRLDVLEDRLKRAGAVKTQPRTHELNLRFDTPGGELSSKRQVLRLRKDLKSWLTYKGAAQPGQAVGMRREIEFEVSSFDEAREFLLALGYQVFMFYEKYRSVYDTGEVLVMLDELPFGCFIEIEGSGVDDIRRTADLLELDWEARCAVSYLELFDRLKTSQRLTARYLSFDELKENKFTPEDFGICRADHQ